MNRTIVILAALTLLFGSIERVNAGYMTLNWPLGYSHPGRHGQQQQRHRWEG